MPKNKVLIVAQALRRTGDIAIRHRFAPAAVVISFFAVVTAFGTVDERPVAIETQTVTERVALEPTSISSAEVGTFWYEERLSRGDTIAAALSRLRLNAGEITKILRDKEAVGVLGQLRPGTALQAEVNDAGELVSLRFVASKDTLLGLDRANDDSFKALDQTIKLESQMVARAGVIRGSFFAAADAGGVPDSIATQLAEVFGTEIDFHREFRRGDRFTVVFETLHHQGRLIRPGRLLGAEVIRHGRTHRAVYFEHAETHGYFSPNGQSLRHGFLRSPLEFTRITSGFEMRFLPGLNRWQEHKGIDYAAPTGTPVRATGDGIVEFIGPQSGYGNVVILKHKGETTTLYAHLHGFAEELKQGGRVTQGEVIGYVGQTGWATGPHLHYEFQVRGTHVDPLTVAMASSSPVPGSLMGKFRAQATPLIARMDMLKNTTLASAE